MKIVVKIGGSMTFDENGPIVSYLNKIVPVLRQIKKRNQLVVSIGGGKYGRKYIKNLKGRLSDKQIEWVFIDLLKANVRLMSFLLDMKPIFSLNEIKNNTTGVIGGLAPGHSTDWGATMASKKIKANLFIKLTNVPYIYDKDPNRYKYAKAIKSMSFSELHKIKTKTSPGHYGVLDPTAIDIITKNKIKTIVMSGKEPKNLLKVLKGEKVGTIVC